MVRHLLPKEAKPIPSFFKASIKLGKITELDYYKYILPYRTDKEFVKKIDYIIENVNSRGEEGYIDELFNLKEEYEAKLK